MAHTRFKEPWGALRQTFPEEHDFTLRLEALEHLAAISQRPLELTRSCHRPALLRPSSSYKRLVYPPR